MWSHNGLVLVVLCVCSQPLNLLTGLMMIGYSLADITLKSAEFLLKVNCGILEQHGMKKEETSDRDLHPHLVSYRSLVAACGFFGLV